MAIHIYVHKLAPRKGSNPKFAWKPLYSYQLTDSVPSVEFGHSKKEILAFLKRNYPNETIIFHTIESTK